MSRAVLCPRSFFIYPAWRDPGDGGGGSRGRARTQARLAQALEVGITVCHEVLAQLHHFAAQPCHHQLVIQPVVLVAARALHLWCDDTRTDTERSALRSSSHVDPT